MLIFEQYCNINVGMFLMYTHKTFLTPSSGDSIDSAIKPVATYIYCSHLGRKLP